MLCSEAVDQIIAFSDNVGQAGADYLNRRERIINWLKQDAADVYYKREWVYRMKWTTAPHVVVAADAGSGELPTDFLMLGKLGAVYNDTEGGLKMDPAPESVVGDLIALSYSLSGAKVFAIFGKNTDSPPKKLIWIPKVATATTLRLLYHQKMPELADSTANGGNDTYDANLDDAIPEEYQQTIILPRLRAHARRSKGDSRWSVDRAEADEALKDMIKNHRRMQGGGQQLPSFFGT